MDKKIKKLPDAEFEVMKQVWAAKPPVTAPMLMEKMEEKEWKMQTLISLLIRLTERGFLKTEKRGRDRFYWPIINREEYLTFETKTFVKNHHENSISSLMTALYDGTKPDKKTLDDLEEWMKNWEKGE